MGNYRNIPLAVFRRSLFVGAYRKTAFLQYDGSLGPARMHKHGFRNKAVNLN